MLHLSIAESKSDTGEDEAFSFEPCEGTLEAFITHVSTSKTRIKVFFTAKWVSEFFCFWYLFQKHATGSAVKQCNHKFWSVIPTSALHDAQEWLRKTQIYERVVVSQTRRRAPGSADSTRLVGGRTSTNPVARLWIPRRKTWSSRPYLKPKSKICPCSSVKFDISQNEKVPWCRARKWMNFWLVFLLKNCKDFKSLPVSPWSVYMSVMFEDRQWNKE